MSDVLFDTKFENGANAPASPFSFVSTSGTVPGSIGNNADRVLIIAVGLSLAVTITALTWAGQAMTSIGTATTAGGRSTRLYGLINPSTGAQTVSMTFTGTAGAVAIGGVSLYNTEQTTGWRNFNSATGSSVNPTVTITTIATSMAVAGFADDNASSFTITSPSVLDWNERAFDGNYQGGHNLSTGTSTVIAGTEGTSVGWAVAGVEVFSPSQGNVAWVTA